MTGTLPLVSVVLPVRNEAQFIEPALDSISAQDYPLERIEVLVVDGESNDNTVAITGRWADQHPRVRLKVHSNPRRIAATALNLGVRAAQGSIVARVDGHCRLRPQHLRAAVEALTSGEADCVGGPVITRGHGSVGEAIAAAMSSRLGVGGSSFRVSNRRAFVDTVPFPAWKRETLDRSGPFDESLVRNQDDEHNARLRAMGMRVLMIPEMTTIYYPRSSLRALWSQYFQYGRWKVRVIARHPRQARLRHFVPSVWVLALVLTAIVAAVSTPLPLASLVLAYAVVLLIATATARGLGLRSRLLVPAALVCLHASYGIGMWWGLLKHLGGHWRKADATG